MMTSIPLLAALALALVLIRIYPRQFSRRRLARQPGFIACLMIVVGAGFCLALLLFIFLLTRWINTANGERVWEFFLFSRFHAMLAFFASHIGCAIVASWICLRMSRRWRPEPDWIDRTGRILGAVWVGFSLFCGALFPWMSN